MLLSRARYYAGRMRDAGVAATAQKIRSLLAPYIWAPAYMSGLASGGVPDNSLERLEQLGAHLRAGLLQHASSDPAYVARAENRARQALSGEWTVLGYGQTGIPVAAGWADDVFNDYRWPHRYFALIDFVAADKHCDVKIPWELSRLQYLVWLAEGYLLLPQMRGEYSARFTAIAEDWIKSNRPGFGVNWTCAMEVAIRGLNLMLAAAVMDEDLSAHTRELVVQSLADHYAFLRRFPELSDVRGNHYLVDLLGEVGLSIVVGRTGAFDHAIGALTNEADNQFEADGCHIERAPVYHRLCTDIVAVGAAFAAGQSGAPPARLLNVLQRAVQFAIFIADTNGQLPVIGDCDSGQVFEFGLPARETAALRALAGDKDRQDVPDFAIWLRAISGRDRAVRISIEPARPVDDRSGFLTAKSGSCSVAMRVGAQGLGGRASHDHDDAQSIWVNAGGRDLIVDQGCHSYTLDPAVRNGDMSSRAHNVLQPVAVPRFGGRKGSISLTMRGAPTCNVATASLIGDVPRLSATIERAAALSSITRVLDLRSVPGGFDLCVSDAWSSAEPVELRWHFGPGLQPEIANGTSVEFGESALIRTLRLEGESLLGLEIFGFDFCPVYGQRLPCFGVRAVLAPASHGTLMSRFQIGTVGQTSH
jgi:hypothetical protein